MVHGENATVVSFTLVRASSRLALRAQATLHVSRLSRADTRRLVARRYAVTGGCEIRAFDGAVPYRIVADKGLFNIRPEWYWNFRHRAESARGLDESRRPVRSGRARGRASARRHCNADAERSVSQPVAAAHGADVVRRSDERGLSARDDGAAPFAREARRQQALVEAAAPTAPAWIRRLALAADQFIVRRGDAGRTVIAGYPLVQRLGSRHDDRAARTHARDRPARRRREHPAHLRALRRARACCRIASPTRRGARVQHRRRDALVLRRARPLPRRDAATGRCVASSIRRCGHHRRGTGAARATASASIPTTVCCTRASPACSSPGWTPRSATGSSRRGSASRSRSTRCGTARSCVMRALRAPTAGDALSERRFDGAAPARRARASATRFWYAAGGYLYDVIDGPDGEAGDGCAAAQSDLRGVARRRTC